MIKLKPTSWKIMLELLVKASPVKVVEVPIQFDERNAGESKFNSKQMIAYVKHLALLALFKYKALIKFGLIGASGAGIHFALLYTFTDIVGLWYIFSAILSIIVASTSNYILNHKFTFKDRTISNHLFGWIKYQLMSGITDLIYLGMLALFVEVFGFWYLAGALLAIVIIFPVKFVVASSLIWSKKIQTGDADYEWNAFYKGSPIQKWWKRSIANTVWKWAPNASNLLDIGCGSSPIISRYQKATGIDVNDSKIEFMSQKLPQLSFENKGIEKFEDKEFDHVLCIEVLEHLDNPIYMISEIARVVKLYGNVIIATPDYDKWLWRFAELFTPYKEDHKYKFTREKLEKICEKHGLEPIRHKYIARCDLIEEFVRVT